MSGLPIGAAPNSTTCWRKPPMSMKRPRGGCARSISRVPMKVIDGAGAEQCGDNGERGAFRFHS